MGGFFCPFRGRLRGRMRRIWGGEYRDTGTAGKGIQGRYTAATGSRCRWSRSSYRGGRFRGLFGKIYRAGGRPFPLLPGADRAGAGAGGGVPGAGGYGAGAGAGVRREMRRKNKKVIFAKNY